MGNAEPRRSGRVQALRAYAVCAAVALLAGCGDLPAPQSNSPITTGFGVVAADPSATTAPSTPATPGTWVLRSQGKILNGALSTRQLQAVARAVRVTQLELDRIADAIT